MSTVLSGQQQQPAAGSPEAGSAAAAGAGNQQSQISADWRSALPEELRGESVFESIKGKDVNEALPVLAKNYVNAQKLVGADRISIPGKNATPEQIAEYHKKLGVPDKPDAYEHKLPEGLKPEQLDTALLTTWKERLHKAGIPKTAAEQIINQYLEDNAGQINAQETARIESDKQNDLSVREKWGDKYDENSNFARHALEQLGTPELAQFFDQSGLGNHPELVEFFAKAGRAIAEDTARGAGDGTGDGAPRTAAAAQAELTRLQNDESFQKALWDESFEGREAHNTAVARRSKLFLVAFPGMKGE